MERSLGDVDDAKQTYRLEQLDTDLQTEVMRLTLHLHFVKARTRKHTLRTP